jgi:DNA-binding beta-propeller fold protein YncE
VAERAWPLPFSLGLLVGIDDRVQVLECTVIIFKNTSGNGNVPAGAPERLSEYELRAKQKMRRRVKVGLAALTISTLVTAILMVLQSRIARDLAKEARAQADIAGNQSILAERAAQRAKLANLSAASAVNPDGTRMLQIDPGGELRIIDLATGRDVSVTGTAAGSMSAAVFSPDGKFIATGTVSGVVSIDDSALKLVRTLRGHTAAVTRIAFSPDGAQLASGSDDSTARIWSVTNGTELGLIKADSPVVGVAFSPDARRLIVSLQSGTIYVVDPQTGEIIR